MLGKILKILMNLIIKPRNEHSIENNTLNQTKNGNNIVIRYRIKIVIEKIPTVYNTLIDMYIHLWDLFNFYLKIFLITNAFNKIEPIINFTKRLGKIM